MQVPDAPTLDSVAAAGIDATILWLLVVMVLGGMGATSLFMWRQVKSTDRIADALAGWPNALGAKLDEIHEDVKAGLEMAREHVRIARMWERSEWPGRVGKKLGDE